MKFSRFRTASHAAAGLSLMAIAAGIMALSSPAAGSPPEKSIPDAPSPTMAATPAHMWSAEALADLAKEVDASEREGLDPAAYRHPALERPMTGAETDRIATGVALALATDYARGRIDDPSRLSWHIERPSFDMEKLSADLDSAVRSNRLRPWL